MKLERENRQELRHGSGPGAVLACGPLRTDLMVGRCHEIDPLRPRAQRAATRNHGKGKSMKLRRRDATGAESGIVLAGVIMLMLVVTIAGGAFLTMAANESQQSVQNTLPTKAMYLAEAGCEWGKMWLSGQVSPPARTDPFTVGNLALGDGNFTVSIDPHNDNPGAYIKSYDIIGVGSVMTDGEAGVVRASKSLTVTMRVESFAKYAYFTDKETSQGGRSTIWFFDGDVITGPLHSNSRINICGAPQFRGKVTSTAESFNFYHGGPPGDNPTFEDGYELEVDKRDMRKAINLASLRSAAESGGLKLKCQSAQVVLNASGTLSYRTKKGRRWSSWRTRSLPANGVMYVDGDVSVKGTLNGQLTIAVGHGKTIEIPDDIRYHVDPSDPSCTDMLGLVAGHEVLVTKSSPRGADLTIHASIMVFDTSFVVDRYARIPAMGDLKVVGGIIQKHRGPVGTFNARTGRKVSGYSKDYQYDTRMVGSTPPLFPTTGEYEFVSYQEGATSFGE